MSDCAETPIPPIQESSLKPKEVAKTKIDVKLLDQQLADLDSDELDSDDDLHTGGCSCCAGQVGQIRED